MEAIRTAYLLEVVHGDDRGARLEVEGTLRTIGRALDRDFVLKDLGVSRRHAEVVATAEGVQFDVCEGAAAVVVDGRPLRSVLVRPGDRVLVGNTLLVVARADLGSATGPRSVRGQLDVRTVLAGVGAEARAMGALHELIEAMDRAENRGALVEAIAAWGAEQTPVCAVELVSGAEASRVVAESTDEAATVIVVPAPAEEPLSIAFRCAAPSDRISDSTRRMLVVAGRLFGSSVVRLRRAEVAAGEVASLRAISFGTSRAFLGTSPAAEQLARLVPRLAASDVNVFLDGETGSGKTFVARLIHEHGPRGKEPLRVINCAAIPETLIESELFGHERGAFTGAVGNRVGALEAAGRGTLFLDEIGELPLTSQSKLLRVLEERSFERIGSNKPLMLEARIITATNRDLEKMIAEKQFRSDLFFRISVVRLRVPALRERGEDIVALAEQLLSDAAQTAGRRISGFSPEALDVIRKYSWPGNVRELRNAIEHAVALGDGALVVPGDFPAGLGPTARQPTEADLVRLPLDLQELERRGIEAAIRHTSGNRTRAAALLGISRPTLNSRLNAMKLSGTEP